MSGLILNNSEQVNPLTEIFAAAGYTVRPAASSPDKNPDRRLPSFLEQKNFVVQGARKDIADFAEINTGLPPQTIEKSAIEIKAALLSVGIDLTKTDHPVGSDAGKMRDDLERARVQSHRESARLSYSVLRYEVEHPISLGHNAGLAQAIKDHVSLGDFPISLVDRTRQDGLEKIQAVLDKALPGTRPPENYIAPFRG